MRKVFLLIITCILIQFTAYAEFKKGDFSIGLKGGYTLLVGDFSEDLTNPPYFGFSAFYNIWDHIAANIDIDYTISKMKSSQDSLFHSVSLGIGPLFHYKLHPRVTPYLGISLQFSYLLLNTDNIDRNVNAFKVGYALKTGTFIPISNGVSANIGFEFTHKIVSNRPFYHTTFLAGAVFNYHSFKRSITPQNTRTKEEILKEKKNYFFSKGVEEYNSGKLSAARDNFSEVLKIDPGHYTSRKYLTSIKSTLDTYNKATTLIQKNNYLAAIPLLTRISDTLPEAKTELARIKALLKKRIPILQQAGIIAYNRRQYKKCIIILEKLQLIDPDNITVRLYLPRARKRYDALRKFQ